MKKRIMSILSAVICAAVAFSFLIVPGSALVMESSESRAVKNELRVLGVKDRNVSYYESEPLFYNGNSLGDMVRIINGKAYVPIKQFTEAVTDYKVTYSAGTKTVTVSGSDLLLSVSDGAYVMYANGRTLFEMTPSVLMNNSGIYVPLASLAKAYSLSYSYNNGIVRLSGTVKGIMSANKYYREDAVYWLSRIISAESRGEPLLGQIAVGTVIMNRVGSDSFPSTIWGVIFDKKYGVQFSPVANGTVYNTPVYNSILAAKICLEGFLVSDEVLYFVAPDVVQNSWIQRTREYQFSIGHHDFFS